MYLYAIHSLKASLYIKSIRFHGIYEYDICKKRAIRVWDNCKQSRKVQEWLGYVLCMYSIE